MYLYLQLFRIKGKFNSLRFLCQNSEAENLMLIEMLDANEDGEVDSFEWTTMLSQVRFAVTS